MNNSQTDSQYDDDYRLNWLSELGKLNAKLRAAGFIISPDRWLNITDLLMALLRDGVLNAEVEDGDKVKHFLAPLVCKSAKEQEDFAHIFQQWWLSVNATEREKQDEVLQELEQQSERLATSSRKFIIFASFMLIVSAIVIVLYVKDLVLESDDIVTVTPQPVPEKVTRTSDPRVELQQPVVTPPPVQDTGAIRQIAPPRLPQVNATEFPLYSAQQKFFIQLAYLLFVLGIPILIFISFLYGGVQQMLRKGKADKDSPLRHLPLRIEQDTLFDEPKVRAAIRSLHSPISIETNRLDPKKTVYASLHHAGLFTPVLASRAEVPEVMVWINNKGKFDPLQAMADTLVERLRAADLRVYVYSFRTRPYRLLNRSSGRWASQAEINAEHANARLILVTESAGLVDPWTGKAIQWISDLAKQFATVVLEPGTPNHNAAQVLKSYAIELASLSSAGIRQVCTSLSETPHVRTKQDIPFLPQILANAERWRTPVRPNKRDRDLLISILRSYLGESGFRLLCASAAYPEFRWGLVRALDASLFVSDSIIERETRLLALAQLPWSRDGWLPDWLRLSLMRSLHADDRAAIRALYQQLLVEVDTFGAAEVKLPVRFQKPKKRLSQYFREWLRWSKADSELQDSVFVELMIGGRFRRLDFELPRALEKLFPIGRFSRYAINSIFAISLTLFSTWGLHKIYQLLSLESYLQEYVFASSIEDQPDVKVFASNQSTLQGRYLVGLFKHAMDSDVEYRNVDDINESDDDVVMVIKEHMQGGGGGAPYGDIETVIFHSGDYAHVAKWLAKNVSYATYGMTPVLVDITDVPKLAALMPTKNSAYVWLPKGYEPNSVFTDNLDWRQSFSSDSSAVQLMQELPVSARDAVFSEDGRYVTTYFDSWIQVWDLTTNREIQTIDLKFEGNGETTLSPEIVSLSRDGRSALVTYNLAGLLSVINWWNIFSGDNSTRTSSDVTAVAFFPDPMIAFATRDGELTVWNATGKQPEASLSEGDYIEHFSVSSQQYAFTTANGALGVGTTDFKSEQILAQSGIQGVPVYSAEDNALAAQLDGKIRVWDSSYTLLGEFEGQLGSASPASFHPPSEQLATLVNGRVKIWSYYTNELLGELYSPNESLIAAVFSPEGNYIVTLSDKNAAQLWHAVTYEKIANLPLANPTQTRTSQPKKPELQGDQAPFIRFSQDGEKVLISNLVTTRVWSLADNPYSNLEPVSAEPDTPSQQQSSEVGAAPEQSVQESDR